MSNEELIRCFENDALPGDSFHHADHVRLAFAYLCRYPVLHALEKFVSALKRFAAARGKTQLYNETITFAYFFLIRERMACCAGLGWEEFARRNPDLLVWKDGILSRYYCEGTLQSDLAREIFVLPDKRFEMQTSGGSVCPREEDAASPRSAGQPRQLSPHGFSATPCSPPADISS
jgi:hypothetical protein